MSAVEELRELGGVARRGAILRRVPRVDLDRAVAGGDVVRDSRGWYALADTDRAVRDVARSGGALCLTSAALVHGWAVKAVPDRPHVVVGRGARVPRGLDLHVHVADLAAGDRVDRVTSPMVTLRQCVRQLPFDEALAVADSALRAGVDPATLHAIGDTARGPGSRQVRRVCRSASGLAANPFESVLRAIALGVPGLSVEPQVVIREPGLVVRPDLADRRRRIVLEADSFEWHGGRAALGRDARRYNLLTVHGWLVLRFSWEQVMFEPDYVRSVLEAAVACAESLSQRAAQRSRPAWTGPAGDC